MDAQGETLAITETITVQPLVLFDVYLIAYS